MKKFICISELRDLENQHIRDEITYSRMVEILCEKAEEYAKSYHKQELKKINQNSWLSPISSEREWQEKHIKKIFPSYPLSSPNWQILNGLIRFSCESLEIEVDE